MFPPRKIFYMFATACFLMILIFPVTKCSQLNNQTHHSPSISPPQNFSTTQTSQQATDESTQIYLNFIDKLLQNQQFVFSLLDSVSSVVYNDWILNLSPDTQKKYLRILLTTIEDGGNMKLTSSDYFELLKKLLEDPNISKEFFKSLNFDFTSEEFKEFVSKEFPEESKDIDLQNLDDNLKAKFYVLALKKEEQLETSKGKKQSLNDDSKIVEKKNRKYTTTHS